MNGVCKANLPSHLTPKLPSFSKKKSKFQGQEFTECEIVCCAHTIHCIVPTVHKRIKNSIKLFILLGEYFILGDAPMRDISHLNERFGGGSHIHIQCQQLKCEGLHPYLSYKVRDISPRSISFVYSPSIILQFVELPMHEKEMLEN